MLNAFVAHCLEIPAITRLKGRNNLENSYRSRIIERLDNQIRKGIAKYGQQLENNKAHVFERLEHLAQELTDALQYIEWIKEALSLNMKCYFSGEDFLPGDRLVVVTDYLGERVIIKEKYYNAYMAGETM